MNRKERRAAKRTGAVSRPGAAAPGIADLLDDARQQYRRGNHAQAEAVCRQILARDSANTDTLNLAGVIAQTTGRHQVAVKMLGRAVESDPFNAACHYNIGVSCRALDRLDEAARHFTKAIALGLSEKDVEDFILQNPVVARIVNRLHDRRIVPVLGDDATSLEAVSTDIFLRCALESVLIRGVGLERYFTRLRSVLLRSAIDSDNTEPGDAAFPVFFCALARQCFINEYVYAQTDDESRQAGELRERLRKKLTDGSEIAPLLVIAVAAYFPLHSLAEAEALLDREWSPAVDGLLRQQVREPREEQRDRAAIPSLTPIENPVSLEVMRQYEENPFPRWTLYPSMAPGIQRKTSNSAEQDILIAGCGTGQHAFQIVELFPNARVLAIDISRPSLAYARRKSREAGLRNIEYAQADIMKLGAIGQTFDRIEAIGVLHHLADPRAGWRVLLSLLRPDGEMHVGLYSELARRNVVAARALIAERGFRPTLEDIRACRQEILQDSDKPSLAGLDGLNDFYNVSGCRDLIFNVMEHRFTIPEIKAFQNEEQLSFLGFQLEAPVIENFRRQFPDESALHDLDCWHAFETVNPTLSVPCTYSR